MSDELRRGLFARFNRMGLMRLKLIETGGANCAPSPPLQQSLPLLFGDGCSCQLKNVLARPRL
jgi:hypothetical protein